MAGAHDVKDTFKKSQDERYARLYPHELAWRDKQLFLESRGYMLRPRFRPGWIPSWRVTGARPLDCEDASQLRMFPHTVDATRMSDGKLVSIKRVHTGSTESHIATMLCSPPLNDDPTNHCVPILDMFEDDEDAVASYMVMPFLRHFDDPPFECVDDVLDFGEQMLEGLSFLHKNGVAHRDGSYANLMMDGGPLFPQGFHPTRTAFLPDCRTVAWPLSRSHNPVKYYFIDFGLSVYIPSDGQPKLATGCYGRDQEPPELSDMDPYDPFKLDIFIMGNVFRKDFYDKFNNVGFLHPIIEAMAHENPGKRPSAAEALEQWQHMRKQVPYVQRRWRLRRREEPLAAALLNDNVYILTLAAHLITGSKTTTNILQN